MLYFAYGSNMLVSRLEERVGAVKVIGLGRLNMHLFTYGKLSIDGSLKADALNTGKETDFLIGVLFDIIPISNAALDKAEGLGKGYSRKNVKVIGLNDSKEYSAFTYCATDPVIKNSGLPYDWYCELIIAGALEHNIPEGYVNALKAHNFKEDLDSERAKINRTLLSKS